MAPSPIAEAFVLIRPDLTGFAATLQRELAQAVGQVKPPQVAVNARVTADSREAVQAAARSAAASKESAAASVAQAAADKQAQIERRKLAAVGTLVTKAEESYARVATAGVGAQTALQAATLKNTAARAALNAAVRANDAALKTENLELQKNSAALLANAAAAEASAAQQVGIARAATQQQARLSQAARGAGATAAAFAGLRGATLAATGPFIAATVAVTALGKAISAGATLEQGLNLFQATSRATAEQMREVSDAAVALGRDVSLPGVSAGDAALTMTELAKAGLSVQDSIDGARGVLLLATAANIDFSQASELAASALNSFGLAGEDAGRVADVFAGAAKAAQGSIQDFALANQQVDAVARQVGFSLEDTTALLAELAKNGLRGSDAGTSLRTALIRLVAPTQEARTLLDQLGVSIRDAQGNVDPLVFARFGEATKNLAPDLRDAITATIFGQDAIRAVAIAAREGADGFEAMRAAVEANGQAQELANARSKGLLGQTSALASNLETFGTTLSQAIIPPLTSFVSLLSDMVSAATEGAQAILDLAGSLGDLAGKIPGVGKLPGIFTNIAKYTGPQGLFFGLARGIDAFTTSSDEAARAAAKLQQAIKDTADAQRTFAPFSDEALTAGATQQEKVLKDRNTKILELIGQLSSTLQTFADTGLADEKVRDSVLSIVDQLESIGGPAVQEALRQNMDGIAGILGGELQSLSEAFGVTLDDLNTSVPQSIRSIIQNLSQSSEGRKVLRQFGAQLSESLAQGIDDGSDKAIEAARRTVRNAAKAVQQAEAAVQDAVERAGEDLAAAVTRGRDNLRSVGDALSQEVAQIINVGPLAQQSKKLQDELDKIEARLEQFRKNRQRDNLNDALTGAQSDLQRQRDQLITLGQGLTKEQQARIGELLAPAQEKVKEATADIQEFNLQAKSDALSGRIDVISDQLAGKADAASKAVQTLVEQLRDGKINAKQFSDRIQNQLAPQLGTLKSVAGKNLGLRFTNEFNDNLKLIVAQATALAGFVSNEGVSSVVNPADTKAAGAQSIADARSRVGETQQALADARANLDRTIKENATNQKTTASNTTKMVNLLTAINTALAPTTAKPKTTRTGGAKPDNNRSVPGSKVGGR